jgi:RNA polymerase sigma-70 factor, ECF subfamily
LNLFLNLFFGLKFILAANSHSKSQSSSQESGAGMVMLMDETMLIKAASKFDRHSLRIIFDSYSPVVYKYALRLCHDSIEADNIVGDVFALLLEQLAKGRGPNTNLRSYLFQTTYHLIVDQARARRHTTQLDVADFQGGHDSPVALQAEDDVTIDAITNTMSTELSHDQRYILILRFIEGFSVHETAKIVGKSTNNVKVIQNRALGKLRRIFHD